MPGFGTKLSDTLPVTHKDSTQEKQEHSFTRSELDANCHKRALSPEGDPELAWGDSPRGEGGRLTWEEGRDELQPGLGWDPAALAVACPSVCVFPRAGSATPSFPRSPGVSRR